LKHSLPETWGTIPAWIRYSPDFLTSSKEAVAKIETNRTWIEWKIFRQYYELFDVAIYEMKEVCYHIGMNSRYMGESSAVAGDMHALDLAIKFFNSYLRLSLNASNVHTVYTVLFQYRLLGEFLVKYASSLKQSKHNPEKIAELERRVFRIPKHLRYYSSQFKLRGIHFLVEVVAHDVRILCETAAKLDAEIHHQLVDIFLTICDQYPAKDKLAKGCRVAQIVLATYYLNIGKEDWARKIFVEVNQDSPENLMKYFQMIKNIIVKEFFEVSERGIDFQYISAEQKEKLAEFKSWFNELKTPRITIPAESGVL
jgi:hypothetical protein